MYTYEVKHLVRAALLLLFFSLFFQNCSDNATGPKEGNSAEGTWIISEVTVYTEDGSETEIYDPENDNYKNAQFLKITQDQVNIFMDRPGPNYEELVYQAKFTNKMLVMWNDVDSDTLEYSVVANKLHLTIDNFFHIEITYVPFDGTIPPESWLEDETLDEYEPDNDPQTATPITVGTKNQQHYLGIDDRDMFTFDALAGENYIIYITSYMDNVLTLYDSDLNILAYDDDNERDIQPETDEHVESVIVWQCLESGSYYFEVGAYDPEYDEGQYSINIEHTTVSPLAKSGGEKKEELHIKELLRRFTF